MSIKDLQAHALPFLSRLDQCTEQEAWNRDQTWQTADDDRNRRDPALTNMFHGPLSAVALKLITLNESGAGIYVAVNRTDRRGRAKRNIVAIRAWHSDLDFKLQEEPHDPHRLPLMPSMIVESGGGGHHDYWLPLTVMDCNGDETRRTEHEAELRGIQVATRIFGSDRSAVDINRPLRLPGTLNQKPGRGVLATLQAVTSLRYDREQIVAAFPPMRREESRHTPAVSAPYTFDERTLRRARAYLKKIPIAVEGQLGHDQALEAAMKMFSFFGLDFASVHRLLIEDFNPACVPPFSPFELKRKVEQAEKFAQPRPLDHKPFIPTRRR